MTVAARYARVATVAALALVAIAGLASSAGAQTTTAIDPELRQLSAQTQALYARLQRGVVRVRVPVPLWLRDVAVRENPLRKWGRRLDPDMRRQLGEQQQSGITHTYMLTVTPANHSSADPAGERSFRLILPMGRVVVRSADGARQLVVIGPIDRRDLLGGDLGQREAINEIGLLLDERGHVLIPVYLEPQAFVEHPLVAQIDRTVLAARFVASDRPTNLTILQLTEPVGQPLPLGIGRPDPGALVVLFNPNVPQPQLGLWTGGGDALGLVAAVDGSSVGFIRYGRFLDPADCRSVIAQLLERGTVHRALLGLVAHPMTLADPAAALVRRMGLPGALRVERVLEDSAAARADVRPGDYLLRLGDQPAGDPVGLAALLAWQRGPAPLTILRDGQTLNLQVDLTDPDDR